MMPVCYIIGPTPEEEQLAIGQVPEAFCPQMLESGRFCHQYGCYKVQRMVLQYTGVLRQLGNSSCVNGSLIGR